VRRRVWLSGVLLGPRPSLPRLAELRCASLFGWFTVLCRGPTPPSVRARQYAICFSAGLPSQQAGGRFPGSRACLSRRAQAYDTGFSSPRVTGRSMCLPLDLQAGIPLVSKLNLLPSILCYASAPPRDGHARLDQDGSLSFPAGLFHPCKHAFIPALRSALHLR